MQQVYRLLAIINKLQIPGCIVITVVFLLFAVELSGQKKCTTPAFLTLSQSGSTICNLMPVTIPGNTFSGSATSVRITSDGGGSLSPSSANVSPFTFSYSPDNSDAGRTVTITVTTNDPAGASCKPAIATYSLNVLVFPPGPEIDYIIQPTCTSSTGSVQLSGLPLNVDWILTVNPGNMTIKGAGATTTVSNLTPGTYTFTVTVNSQCISAASQEAVILEQPVTPTPPLPGSITAPTCSVATGNVKMTGLPADGIWMLTRYPGTENLNGSGTESDVSDLPPGIYNFTVTSASGCTSGLSANVVIPDQPPVPASPALGTIIQPTMAIPAGSVTLNDLPATGMWKIIRSPDGVLSTGSGTNFTISGLGAGSYTFKVSNSFGCFSPESAQLIISLPDRPELVITDPPPVCYPSAIDLTAPWIKTGSTSGLTFSYWKDNNATEPLENPSKATNGIYYIKGTLTSGFFDIKPVIAVVKQPSVANAGQDQNLAFQFNTVLNASLGAGETGLWDADSDNVNFNNPSDPGSAVSNLSPGDNNLSWIVTNGVCPADTDKIKITVGEVVIPTLITPNGDTRNDYFVIKGLESLGRTELIVFDRRGIQIYHKNEYDNSWNGVDYNEEPLANDTYFFVLRTVNGKSYTGYIVVRR